MARLANFATPKLRVLSKISPWNKVNLGEYLSFKNGINADKDSYGSGYKFINVLDIINNDFIKHDSIIGSVSVDEKTFLNNEVAYGDILFQRSSENREEAGQSNVYLDKKHTATFGGFVIRGKPLKDYNPIYLNYLLKSWLVRREVIRKSGGSTRYNVGQDTLSSVELFITDCEDEQNEIADVFSSVDIKIKLLKEKHVLLEQYKKGVMQKLFSQEIRFKDENGNAFPDWSNAKFEQVFERVTQKNKENNQNVLTISAQRGLINQQKYFNKSVSAKNVTGYYLLNNGDFAYNKSYSKGYPMGAIKRLNNYEKGVVSTLYICFKSHGNQHDEFWEQYFEAGLLNREISKIAQEGARNHGLLNVSVTEFFKDITVHEPSEKEQIRIAEFLGTLDKKLELVSQQIEQTQTFKKGLLQQMFV